MALDVDESIFTTVDLKDLQGLLKRRELLLPWYCSLFARVNAGCQKPSELENPGSLRALLKTPRSGLNQVPKVVPLALGVVNSLSASSNSVALDRAAVASE